jgi:hypothetical protein
MLKIDVGSTCKAGDLVDTSKEKSHILALAAPSVQSPMPLRGPGKEIGN